MSHDKASADQVVAFLEDAMATLAINIRDHELCPECATSAFMRVLITAIEAGLIKQLEDYTAEERARLPYFTEAADDFFYSGRVVDDIGDPMGTA